MDGVTMTYAELDRRSNRLAHAMMTAGVTGGDRVALLARNRLDYAVIAQAAVKAGAMFVPVNGKLTAGEIAHVLESAEPKLILIEEEFRASVEKAKREAGSACRILVLAPHDDASGASTRELDEASAPETQPDVAVDPASPAMIMYTSGTTGRPKGVLYSHEKFLHMYYGTVIETCYRHDDVMLASLPLFYNAGLNGALNPTLFLGGTVVIHRGAFEPAAILGLMERHRVTVCLWVPTAILMLADEMKKGAYDVSSLERVMYGGMPIPPSIYKTGREIFNAKFYQIYGTTECDNVTVLRHEDHVKWSQTSGRAFFNAEFRVVRDDGTDALEGEVGEVICRQATQGMMGYWRNEAGTAETIRDGWIYTGDLVRVEAEGYFSVVDRKRDVIIRGGENIYPKEIEVLLLKHPAVREAAVFGIPDDLYGEAVCAAVALKDGAVASEREISDYCAERLARFKRPTLIEFHDALPRNASEKIVKPKLRERHWQGRGRAI